MSWRALRLVTGSLTSSGYSSILTRLQLAHLLMNPVTAVRLTYPSLGILVAGHAVMTVALSQVTLGVYPMLLGSFLGITGYLLLSFSFLARTLAGQPAPTWFRWNPGGILGALAAGLGGLNSLTLLLQGIRTGFSPNLLEYAILGFTLIILGLQTALATLLATILTDG